MSEKNTYDRHRRGGNVRPGAGLGGYGVSGLSGSDRNESDNLVRTRKLGIPAHLGHDPSLVEGADLVAYSAAIGPENANGWRPIRLGIASVGRAELFGTRSRLSREVIAVAGTHGKTTATGMITQLLLGGGRDPSAIVGGYLPLPGGQRAPGSEGTCLVREACAVAETLFGPVARYGRAAHH